MYFDGISSSVNFLLSAKNQEAGQNQLETGIWKNEKVECEEENESKKKKMMMIMMKKEKKGVWI